MSRLCSRLAGDWNHGEGIVGELWFTDLAVDAGCQLGIYTQPPRGLGFPTAWLLDSDNGTGTPALRAPKSDVLGEGAGARWELLGFF